MIAPNAIQANGTDTSEKNFIKTNKVCFEFCELFLFSKVLCWILAQTLQKRSSTIKMFTTFIGLGGFDGGQTGDFHLGMRLLWNAIVQTARKKHINEIATRLAILIE